MAIIRSDFANECMTQALYFGVNPHYVVAIGQLRSGINDDTKDNLVGPFRLTQAQWDANSSDPDFALALRPTDISAWDMQCAVFALMTYRSQNRLLSQLERYPSAVELYGDQFPNDPAQLPQDLQSALDATTALIDPAAQAIFGGPITPEPVIANPTTPPPPPPSEPEDPPAPSPPQPVPTPTPAPTPAPTPPPGPKPLPASATGLFVFKAPQVMNKLMHDFGFTDIQAAGILGNIGHECNGFRTMQEVHPVSGRGGFGWVQWTGPRRVNFEAFCRRNGFQQTSDDANYGFLKFELQGSESPTVPAVKATRTVEDATSTFEGKFERAGVAAINSRITWAKRALAAFKNQ